MIFEYSTYNFLLAMIVYAVCLLNLVNFISNTSDCFFKTSVS